MALGLEKQQGSARKRKRKIIRRKFCLEDKVEVRSEDEGFLGSWHSGTIIACQTRGCKVKYSVKYDHMLADDGSGHLVDRVCVSLPVDDVDGANENWCNHRGKIRPLPPMIEFGPYNLPYGMCVDVNYKEGWWEGVIFDYEDDLEERKVFFPDLGDEMMIHVETLRITQDWNEVAETWKPRGTWLLLELIEKHAQSTYMPVSVRQIWYDLREKEGFQKLGEWTSSGEALWEALLLEAIGDSHKVFLRHLSGVIDLWEAAQQQSKAANDDFMYPVADLAETHFLVPAENMSQNSTLLYLSSNCQSIQQAFDVEQLISLSPSDPQKSNLLTECNRFIFQPQALAVLDSSLNGIPYVTNGGEICHSYSKKNERKNSSSRCGKTVWQPAGQGVVSGAEFSPDAIIQYTQQGVKQDDSLRIKVRNHLLHQKWKIEFMRDGTMRRIRYTSPEGQIYHSLIQVCLDLRQNDSKSLYLISGDKEESAHSTDSHSLPLVIGLPAVNPEVCRSQLVDSSQFDEVAVEPEYCPQAIEDWYTFGYKERLKGNTKRADLHQMTLRAKKHLLSVGWKFWYTTCSSGKVELRYGSPRGKCYISLRLACKDAMDAGDTTVSKMVEEESASGKVSSPSSKMGIQIQYNYSTASSMSHFRKPVQLLKTNVQANRKVWKTRNGCHQTKGNLDAQNFNMPGFGSRRNGSLSRGLISRRVNKNSTQTTRVLRSKKRVQQVVISNLSHRKPRNLLSWLIENNVLLPRAKVRYRRQKDGLPIAEGRITRDGIKCSCCRKVFTLSGFEVHAGGKNHRPAVCIFLEDGRSLLDCQKEMMRNFKAGPSSKSKGSWHQGKNDHICSVCHYGGELILCDECPSSFHKSCLGMENVPDGDWFCPSCCCKICGQNKLEKGTGHPMHDGLVSCVQCEHKYHSGCVGTRADKSECLPTESWFCSKNCEAIFLGLHELLGKPIPVGVDNLTWTLLKSEQPDDTKLAATDIEILAESHSKLNIALDVIHECFEPIEEPHTGRDVVKDVIFCQGSELNHLNFQGFYTVLLEKHDEIITVATVRIYGAKVAEMPLVGTRFQYRRLGMCRILMNVLEKRLAELGVQRLVLPAVPSVLDTWTRSFGFTKMTDSERLNFVDCTFLDFQDTVMCHKILIKIPSAEPEMQLILHDGVCGSGEYIDLDGSNAVSEVFQADHVHDAGNVKQGLMDIAAADCSVGGKDPVHSVTTVNRPTPAVCEHRVSDIILEGLVKDSASGKERNADCIASTTYNKESRFHGIDGLKCYKRRKIVAR